MATIISQYLDTNGDGSGTKQQATAAAEYYIQPPSTRRYEIHRMIVSYQDTANWSPTEYGNLGAVLTNGIKVEVQYDDDTLVYSLTDADFPIKQNSDWADMCHDFTLLNFGTGDDVCTIRWTFARSGKPVHLRDGMKLVVNIQDDLSLLTSHRCLVQGFMTNRGRW